MKYLTAEEILVLHALVIDGYGGSHGVRDVGLLQSIAYKPQTSFGGRDMYSSIWSKAAVLCESITNYHVFIDGNKRTALIVLGRFLAVNGYELNLSNEQAEKLIYDIAKKALDLNGIADLLESHSKKIRKQGK